MHIYKTNIDVMILQLVEHNIVCIKSINTNTIKIISGHLKQHDHSIMTVTTSIMLLSSSQLYM